MKPLAPWNKLFQEDILWVWLYVYFEFLKGKKSYHVFKVLSCVQKLKKTYSRPLVKSVQTYAVWEITLIMSLGKNVFYKEALITHTYIQNQRFKLLKRGSPFSKVS